MHAVWAEITANKRELTTNRDLTNAENQWITQYQEAIATHELQESSCAEIENQDDPRFVYSKFLRFMKQTDDEIILNEEAQGWSNQYQNEEASASDITSSDNLTRVWDKEAINTEEGPGSSKFWDKLQEEWKN